ncbi:MAG: FG-GAP-like repeat-containing protein [Vicingaceae bacterium]|jgi:hypothetical protein
MSNRIINLIALVFFGSIFSNGSSTYGFEMFQSTPDTLFFDSFDGDLSNWNNPTEEGSWSTNSGLLRGDYNITCGSTTCPQADLIVNDPSQPIDNWKVTQSFTEYVAYTGTNGYLAKFGVFVDADNKINLSVGEITAGAQDSVRISLSHWNGSWSSYTLPGLSSNRRIVYEGGWNSNEINTASIQKNGTTYRIYLNDKFLISFEDTYLNGSGKVGVHTYGGVESLSFLIEQNVFPDSLIAYYPFSGNAADSSGKGNDGTVNGATLTTDRFGNANSAYSFDGVDDNISGEFDYNFDNNSLTVSAWVSVAGGPGFPSNSFPRIVELEGTTDEFIRLMYAISGGAYQVFLSNLSAPDFLNVDAEISTWQFLTASYNPSDLTIRFYVDGELIDSTVTGGGSLGNYSNFFIGNNGLGDRQFRGKIDEVRIYNEVLENSSILELYQNYHAPDTLIAEAGFQEATLKWSAEKIEGLQSYQIYRDGSLVDSVVVSSVNDTTFTNTGLTVGQEYEFYITSRDTLGNVSQSSETVSVTPTDGLVASYLFSGNASDSSGNGNNGTVNGATLTADRFGDANSAYSFDGVDDQITAKNSEILEAGVGDTFTWSGWVKPQNLPYTDFTTWIANTDSTIQTARNWEFQAINAGTNFRFVYRNDSNTDYHIWTPEDGLKEEWTHITYVYEFGDGSSIKYYINGVQEGGSWTQNDGNAEPLDISNNIFSVGSKFNTEYWEGVTDDIKIFNAGLDEAQVLQLYANYHAPDTLITEAGFQEATLKWSSERIAGLQSYQIYRDGSLVDSVVASTVNDTSFTDTGLTAGQSYNYHITSRDSLGNVSQSSDTVSVVPLDNSSPIVYKNALYHRNLKSDFSSFTIGNLDEIFHDPDGDSLQFQVQVSGDNVISASINSITNWLSIHNLSNGVGVDTLTIIATDGEESVNTKVGFNVNSYGPAIFNTDSLVLIQGESSSAFAIDFDNDHDHDILTTGGLADRISFHENTGALSFTRSTVGSMDGPWDVFAIDMDNDGDLDALSASFRDDAINWFENDGTQNFIKHTISDSADNARSVFAIDVDGDGDIDAMSVSSIDNKVVWYENDGDLNFTEHLLDNTLSHPESIHATDIDNDGDVDILTATTLSDNITLFENDGDENFTIVPISTIENSAEDVFTADIDSDGDKDIVSVAQLDDAVRWFQNNGDGTFSRRGITNSADGAWTAFAIDLDGDGDTDLLSASRFDDTIAWYENDGNESFTKRIITSSFDYAQRVFASDLDNDGDIDVIATSTNDNSTIIFENTQSILSSSNLAADYRFTGNVVDSSGNSNDATVNGATLAQDRFSNANSAYTFDGLDDHLTVSHSTALEIFDEEFSIGLWFNKNNTTENEVLLRKAGNDDTGIELKVKQDSVFLGYNLSGAGNVLKTGNVINPNSWYYLNVIRKDSIVTVYLDSDSLTSAVIKSDFNNTETLYIGSDRNINKFWDGEIDDIHLYDSALSKAQIDSLYGLNNWPLATSMDSTLFFSEYIEGSSNNRAIEVYNPTGSAIDLSNYRVYRANNGGSISDTLQLTGSLGSKSVYTIANPSAQTSILDVSDTTHSVTIFNGNDFIGLYINENGTWVMIDGIGVLEEDPGTAWDVAGVTGGTKDHTLLRKQSIIKGQTTWASSAGTDRDSSEWWVLAQNDTSNIGFPTPNDFQPDALLAYYPFSRNAVDSTGNGNDGTVSGAVLTTDRFGSANSAYSFDGFNDKISGAFNSSFNSDSLTLSAWVLINRTPNNDFPRIIELEGNSGEFIRLMYSKVDDAYRVFISNLDGTDFLNVDAETDVWKHLVASYDPSDLTIRLYIDGELLASVVTGGGSLGSSFSNFYIGNNGGIGDRPFNGKIDEVRVYNDVLGSSSVLDLYKNYHGPDQLQATAGIDSVALSWSSERISTISNYYIYRDNTLIDSVGVATASDTTYIDTGVQGNGSYHYFITSKDNSGNISQSSDTLAVETTPLFIAQILPNAITSGSDFKIFGSGFASTNTVKIGNTDATGISVNSSGTMLQATVPNGVSSGKYSVVISNSNGADTLQNALLILKEEESEFTKQEIINENISSGTYSVHSGDLNNNGFNDVVVANYDSDNIIWYKNLGNKTFDSGSIITSPSGSDLGARDVHVVDLDFDGYADILFGQFDDGGRVAWYKNNGNGTFASKQEIAPTGEAIGSEDVNVGDLNSDGYLDVIAVANSGGVFWYQNNKDGTFSSVKEIDNATNVPSAKKVVVEDLDNDGNLDLIVSSQLPGQVFWYKNDGNGNFSTQNEIAPSTAFNLVWGIAVADFNSDGLKDIIVSENNTPNRTLLFKNLGSDNFDSGTEITQNPMQITDFDAIDLDGDGDFDIVAASPNDNSIYQFTNNGNATFTRTLVTHLADGARNVHSSDLDNDGDLDLISASNNDGKVAWYENKIPSVRITEAKLTGAPVNGSIEIYGANFDTVGVLDVTIGGVSATITEKKSSRLKVTVPEVNTGFAELVVSDASTADSLPQKFSVLQNKAPMFLEEKTLFSISDVINVRSGDLNGDGFLDLMTVSDAGNEISWFRNNGNDTYSDRIPLLDGFQNYDIFPVDLDNDGDLDIVATVITQNTGPTDDDQLVWFRNDGGTFSSAIIISNVLNGARDVYPSDLDADGDMDLIVATIIDHQVSWFRNENGSFSDQITITTSAINSTGVHAADLNYDGYPDVISASAGDEAVAWYPNDGESNFPNRIILMENEVELQEVRTADLDGDGFLDVISTGADSTVVWFRNDGNGDLSDRRSVGTDLHFPADIFPGDLDGDGDIDVVASSFNDGNIVWYENLGSGTFSDKNGLSGSLNRAFGLDVADYDGDGDLDITAALRFEGASVVFFENGQESKLTRVEPVSGPVGSTTTLFGFNFVGDGSDKVFFGNTEATVSSSSTNKIIVTVPQGLVGQQDVVVTNTNGPDTLHASFHATLRKQFNFPTLNDLGNFSFNNGGVQEVEAVDMDLDGFEDLVFISFNNDRVEFLKGNGDGTYQAPELISTEPNGPVSLKISDLDNNGFKDIIVGSSLDDEVIWIKNNGDNFATQPVFTNTVNYPIDIEAADLNGDGFNDIIVAGEDEGVRIFINQDATFPSFTTLSSSIDVQNVDIGDINGDGQLDIAITIFGSSNREVAWYLNNNGNFDARISLIDDNSVRPELVDIVDLDSDGDQDIIYSEGFNDDLYWFENTGNGTLISPKLINSNFDGLRFGELYALDLDGDGDRDIIGSGGNRFYENIGDANFITKFTDSALFGDNVITYGDPDGDGDLDLFSPDRSDGNIRWFENDIPLNLFSTNRTGATTGSDIKIQGSGFAGNGTDEIQIGGVAASFVAGDFSEITVTVPNIATGNRPITISNLVGQDTLVDFTVIQTKLPQFTPTSQVLDPSDIVEYVSDGVIFDVDKDGNKDFVLGQNDGLKWFAGNGDGTFSSSGTSVSGFVPYDINIIDMDNDGDNDFVYRSSDYSSIYISRDIGSNIYTTNTITTSGISFDLKLIDTEDALTKDGFVDILIITQNVDKLFVNLRDGTFQNIPVSTSSGTSSSQELVNVQDAEIFDIDGDGFEDVIAISNLGRITRSFYNPASQSSIDYFNSRSNFPTGATDIEVGDIDGDGIEDLVFASTDYGFFKDIILQNTVDEADQLTPDLTSIDSEVNDIQFDLIDLDGDTDLDIIARIRTTDPSNVVRKIVWFRNDGSGGFSSLIPLIYDDAVINYDLSDIDNDGRLDLIVFQETVEASDQFGVQTFLNPFVQSITSISSDKVLPGDELIIYGAGFTSDQTDTVTIGGTEATVTESSFNRIKVLIPSLSEGDQTIRVGNGNGSIVYPKTITLLGQGSVSFSGQIEISSTLDGAESVHVADMDGDGYKDIIITTDIAPRSLRLFENNGNSTFSESNEINPTVALEGIETADLDRDGNLDIVNGNLWYENIGEGIYGSAKTITSFNNRIINFEDRNSDGYVDVIYGTGSIQYNNGEEIFENTFSDALHNSGTVASFADIDGDGVRDIIYSDHVSGSNILWNKGQEVGGFESSSTTILAGSLSIQWIESGDIDGDGLNDIIVSQSTNEISWLKNQGGGTFGTLNVIAVNLNEPKKIELADLDGDADPEIVFLEAEKVSWIENLGAGNFSQTQLITDQVDEPRDFEIADIDNDGRLDIFVASFEDDKLTWYRNENLVPSDLSLTVNATSIEVAWSPTSGITVDGYNIYRSEQSFSSTTTADKLNSSLEVGTSFTDNSVQENKIYHYRITAIESSSGTESVLSREVTGRFKINSLSNLSSMHGKSGDTLKVAGSNLTLNENLITIAFDNGSVSTPANVIDAEESFIKFQIPDLTVGKYSINFVVDGVELTYQEPFSILGDENGNFRDIEGIGALSGISEKIASVDLDSDGYLDIVALSKESSASIGWFRNNGNGGFANFTSITSSFTPVSASGNASLYFDFADINGDSLIDIVFSSPEDDAIFVVPSNGNSSFLSEIEVVDSVENVTGLSLDDVDADGDKDIIFIEETTNGVYWVENLNNFNFGNPIEVEAGPALNSPVSLVSRDISGDGYSEIIVARSTESSLSVYHNNTDGTFGDSQNLNTPITTPWVINPFDIDKDGDEDLAIYSVVDSTLSIMLNDSTGIFGSSLISEKVPINSFDIADINGDGANDIVFIDNDAGFSFMTFSEIQLNEPVVIKAGTINSQNLEAFDYDGDGDVDVFIDNIQNSSPSLVSFFENVDNPPAAPSNFVVTNPIGRIELNWSLNTETDFAGYRVFRSKLADQNFTEISSGLSTDITITDDNVGNGLIYYYYVAAEDLSQNIVSSDTLSIKAILPRITDFYPKNGIPGSKITIEGSGLISSSGETEIRFGTDQAIISNINDDSTKIEVQIPTLPVGPVSLKATILGYEFETKVPFWVLASNNGTFSTPLSMQTNGAEGNIISNDVDGDGFTDLIHSNYSTTNNSLLFTRNLNERNSDLEIISSGGYNKVVAADLTGGTFPDFIALSNVDNQFKLERNDGVSSSITSRYSSQEFEADHRNAIDITVNDINRDGRNDVIIASETDKTINVYLNEYDSDTDVVSFTSENNISSSADNVQSIYSLDLNGDGFGDIISAELNRVSVYTNTQTFPFTKTDLVTGLQGVVYIRAADVTGNGFQDIIYTSESSGIYYHEQVSKNTFGNAIQVSDQPSSVFEVGDLDGDGDIDVVANNINDGTIVSYVNNATGSFNESRVIVNEPDISGFHSIALLDIENDGDLDIASRYTDRVLISYNIVQTPVSFVSSSVETIPFGNAELSLEFQENLNVTDISQFKSYLSDVVIQDNNNTVVNVSSFNVTDSSIVLDLNSIVYASDTVRVKIGSDPLFAATLGEYFIDGNNNDVYESDNDDYFSESIQVGVAADFDASGIVDFEDVMLFSDGWDDNDFRYELSPVIVKPNSTFPKIRLIGNQKYDINDLVNFIRIWNYGQEIQSKEVGGNDLLAKSLANKEDIQYQEVISSELVSTSDFYSSEDKNVELTYSFTLNTDKLLKGMSIQFKYDKKAVKVTEILDAKLFEVNEKGNNLFLSHNDTTNGILTMQVVNFGADVDIEGSEIAQVTFSSKSKKELEMEVFSDIRTVKGPRILTSSKTKLSFNSAIPENFELLQNFPNPFNPTTTIRYKLNEDTKVSLAVYNILGQRVVELVRRDQKAGYYQYQFDARNLASGMYFYQLRTNNKVSTKKMMLIK